MNEAGESRTGEGVAHPQLKITLNRDGVIAPMMTALKTSLDAVALFLSTLEKADVDNIPSIPGVFVQVGLTLTDVDADKRRELLVSWIFGKGFHDLARSLRQSLEEAYFYLRLLNSPSGVTTMRTVQEKIRQSAKEANDLHFPDLMTQVNKGLTSPLSFAKEYLSLQRARNCLEHRAGYVGGRDVDDNGEMKLELPYMEMVVERGTGEVVPVVDGYTADGGEMLSMRRTLMTKNYKLGEKFSIDGVDFTKIAQACLFFAFDLYAKLPVRADTPAPLEQTT